MTTAELEARAAQRAREQHVHIFAIPGRPGYYQTSSKSESGVKYVMVVRDSEIACACKGFAWRHSCKHVSALEARLAREHIAAERTARKASTSDLYAA
jgi:hypothetical protein